MRRKEVVQGSHPHGGDKAGEGDRKGAWCKRRRSSGGHPCGNGEMRERKPSRGGTKGGRSTEEEEGCAGVSSQQWWGEGRKSQGAV